MNKFSRKILIKKDLKLRYFVKKIVKIALVASIPDPSMLSTLTLLKYFLNLHNFGSH